MINPNVEELKIKIHAVEPIQVKVNENTPKISARISAVSNMGVTPSPGAGAGTSDYERLKNKPSINNVTLIGNKTSKQLGLQDEMDSLTNIELDDLIQF